MKKLGIIFIVIIEVAFPWLAVAQTDVSVRVAVIPFEIFSMEETPNLGKELAIQLSQQLALNPRILTCNSSLIETSLRGKKGTVLNQQHLQELAKALDAHFIVFGSLTRLQNDLSMDIQLFNDFDKEAYFKTFAEGTRLDAVIREVSGKIEQEMMKKAALVPPALLPRVAAIPKQEPPEELPAEIKEQQTPEQKKTSGEGKITPEVKKSEESKPSPSAVTSLPPAEEEAEELSQEEKPPALEKKVEKPPASAEKETAKASIAKEASQEKKAGPQSFGGSNLPVNIHSDSLEYDNKQNRVAFNGHVVARQGDMVIFADSMNVTYEPKGKLKQIEAHGGVKIIQGDRIATGDNIIFYNELQKIVLSGNPRVWQGDNVINGEKITVFIKDERSIVEGSTANRVSATIVPKKKGQKTGQEKPNQ